MNNILENNKILIFTVPNLTFTYESLTKHVRLFNHNLFVTMF
jgi:hypothetical protein